MEISKEQVLEMSTWGNSSDQLKVKKWFPEAFKVELEVGKVYITTRESIIKCKSFGFDDIIGYGFSDTKDWLTEYVCKVKREATTEEWGSALIEEARKRGYKNGNHKCLSDWSTSELAIDNYFLDENDLFIGKDGGANNIIFKDGVWAEIIKTFSKEEAEKLLGGKII